MRSPNSYSELRIDSLGQHARAPRTDSLRPYAPTSDTVNVKFGGGKADEKSKLPSSMRYQYGCHVNPLRGGRANPS
jgi:hypothetical protein